MSAEKLARLTELLQEQASKEAPTREGPGEWKELDDLLQKKAVGETYTPTYTTEYLNADEAEELDKLIQKRTSEQNR